MYELKESRQMKPKTFANMVGWSSSYSMDTIWSAGVQHVVWEAVWSFLCGANCRWPRPSDLQALHLQYGTYINFFGCIQIGYIQTLKCLPKCNYLWQDLIGCITEPVDFVAGGTCEEQLMGMCETLWEPNMKPDQLFECISQVEWSSLIIYLKKLTLDTKSNFPSHNTRPWILNILPHGQNVFLCPGGDERDGQRRHLWLGGCCPHHWEGQGACFTLEI